MFNVKKNVFLKRFWEMVNCTKMIFFLKSKYKLRKKVTHYTRCDKNNKIHFTNCDNLFYILTIQ